MKSLVISTMYPTFHDPTYGIYVKETVENLKKHKGVSYTIIAPFTDIRGIYMTPVKYIYVFAKTLYNSFFGRNFDVIHAHYVFPAGLFALLPKYMSKKRLIVTAHGSDINLLPKKNKIFWYLTRFVMRKADGVIAVSRPLREKITGEFGIDEGKVKLISCGIDPTLFYPRDKLLCRDMLSLPKDKYILFHLSSMDPVKRVEMLIEAFANLRKKHDDVYLIIGGSGSQAGKYKKMVQDLALSDAVLFTGFISKSDVPIWMGASDVFVLTSESEGTPVTLIECIAMGKDTVVSAVGGMPDVVGDSGVILNEPTAKDFCRAISELKENKIRFNVNKRIERSRAYYFESMAEKIYREYQF